MLHPARTLRRLPWRAAANFSTARRVYLQDIQPREPSINEHQAFVGVDRGTARRKAEELSSQSLQRSELKHKKPENIEWDSTKAPAAYLSTLINSETPASKLWEVFNQLFPSKDCAALTEPAFVDQQHLMGGRIFHKLLLRVSDSWFHKPMGILPPPSQILDRYQQLGIFRAEWYEEAIWRIIVPLIKNGRGDDSHETSSRKPPDHTVSLLHYTEMLRLWDRLLSEYSPNRATLKEEQMRREFFGTTTDSSKDDLPDWRGLPQSLGKHQVKPTTEWRVIDRLRSTIPSYPVGRLPSLSAAALATNRLLIHELPETTDPNEIVLWNKFRAASKPFLRYLTRILHRADASRSVSQLSTRLQLDSGEMTVSAKKFLAGLEMLLKRIQPLALPGGTWTLRVNPSAAPKASEITHFAQQINRAANYGNDRRLQELWEEMKMAYACSSDGVERENGKAQEGSNIPEALYLQILHAFCLIGQVDNAVMVWNFMLENGVQPGVTHWTAMLEGCAIARDVPMIQRLWDQMQVSGIEIDGQAWGVYISALLSTGHRSRALEEMKQMGANWTTAAKREIVTGAANDLSALGDFPGAPKPNVVIMNDCLRWNASRGKPDADFTRHIVQWASSYGIKPDVITFNTLIDLTLKGSDWQDLAGCLKILQQMDAAGVKPDASTFAMLIKSIMTSETLSPEQKLSMVNGILDNLGSYGVEEAPGLYSAIIDGLLTEDQNVSGAKAVMEYMNKRKLAIPLVSYGRIMRYHFYGTLTPGARAVAKPDVPAIEALLHQMKVNSVEPDHRFYNLLVLRYARTGMISEAFSFLSKMSSLGMKPTWQALDVLVQACARQGMWQRVQMIVNEARESGGLLPNGVMRSTHQVLFWRTCGKLGVRLEKDEVRLKDMDVPDEDRGANTEQERQDAFGKTGVHRRSSAVELN